VSLRNRLRVLKTLVWLWSYGVKGRIICVEEDCDQQIPWWKFLFGWNLCGMHHFMNRRLS